MAPASFPRSSVLLLAQNAVQSLIPSTLVSQVEALLGSHRIQDAADLADQQRKKVEGNIRINEDEVDELRYVHQRIGWQLFSETLFEDAGKNLFNGDTDPRLLISYYPDLRGDLFTSDDTLDVFSGVAERMPSEASVDDIIVYNLVRNYSPHLSPNTASAPPTVELHRIMSMAAHDMLESYLRKCWIRRCVDPKAVPGSHPAYPVVDTVYAKILAVNAKTSELAALIQDERSEIVATEIEPVLIQHSQFDALTTLYQRHGDARKLLELYSKVADGEYQTDQIRDPLESITTLLAAQKDRALTQQWALWMIKRDPERGLKLLMPARDTGKRREKPEEDLALLEQVTEASKEAGQLFLEYLVLQRRSSSRELHSRLANVLVDNLLDSAGDASTLRLWQAKARSFATSHDVSFLRYFATTTPESRTKQDRLKAAFFLQRSDLYDCAAVRERLAQSQWAALFAVEIAILDGKLGHHQEALKALVHDVRDEVSAETYCALGGEVVPPKMVQASVGDSLGPVWTAWAARAAAGKKTVDEGLRRELLRILLEVYMGETDAESETRAARLLNAQGVNLEVVDVVSLVPPAWPLKTLSTFLTRSFRRTLHARHEGKLVKAISAGQNLEVKDRSWHVIRERGMLIEEAEDDGSGDGDVEEDVVDEKAALAAAGQDVDEHVELGEAGWTEPDTADVHVTV
ncbi:hypothetical protein BD626DRAFT_272035 [Schizophyllum amplum]|uniref:Uncharacterized protein n=1 Tax=Schizophyllum amplum TaxID=97359 RepID=A0A550CF66_9AGAR|nr:hypothetical protein BD626DRAFT_272035 [Auriculariopsis ampla]